MRNRSNYTFAWQLYDAMLKEYTHRYGKVHGASKHRKVLLNCRQFMPWSLAGGLTPHPQCFSGHDDCKTDEAWPIEAYRAFYKVDKAAFARWDKGGREMPHWMGETA